MHSVEQRLIRGVVFHCLERLAGQLRIPRFRNISELHGRIMDDDDDDSDLDV